MCTEPSVHCETSVHREPSVTRQGLPKMQVNYARFRVRNCIIIVCAVAACRLLTMTEHKVPYGASPFSRHCRCHNVVPTTGTDLHLTGFERRIKSSVHSKYAALPPCTSTYVGIAHLHPSQVGRRAPVADSCAYGPNRCALAQFRASCGVFHCVVCRISLCRVSCVLCCVLCRVSCVVSCDMFHVSCVMCGAVSCGASRYSTRARTATRTAERAQQEQGALSTAIRTISAATSPADRNLRCCGRCASPKP